MSFGSGGGSRRCDVIWADAWRTILTGHDNERVIFSLEQSDSFYEFVFWVDTCNQKLFHLRG